MPIAGRDAKGFGREGPYCHRRGQRRKRQPSARRNGTPHSATHVRLRDHPRTTRRAHINRTVGKVRGIPQKTRGKLGKEAKGHDIRTRNAETNTTIPHSPPPTGGAITPTLRVGNPATTETTPIPRRLLNRLRGAEEPTPSPLGEGAVSENRLGTQVSSASRPHLPGGVALAIASDNGIK